MKKLLLLILFIVLQTMNVFALPTSDADAPQFSQTKSWIFVSCFWILLVLVLLWWWRHTKKLIKKAEKKEQNN